MKSAKVARLLFAGRLVLAALGLLIAGCGGDEAVLPTGPGDSTAPGTVADLRVTWATTTTVNLAWSAAGDDGDVGTAAAFEVRSTAYPADPFGWDSWEIETAAGVPAAPGLAQSHTVTGLDAGAVRVYRVRTRDEAGNLSEPSNPVIATAAPQHDTTAPGAVQDLAVWSSDGSRLTVSWLATGDDGPLGQAAGYEVRLAAAPLSDADWAAATPVANGSPGPAGTRCRADIPGLDPDTTYHVAVRLRDEQGNWSAVSNSLAAETVVRNTWYVTPDGLGDAPTIQAAIVQARPGDTVLVAPGHYTWTNQDAGNHDTHGWGMLVFWRDVKGFTVRSEGGPEVTIIDAEQQNRCLYIMGYNDGIVIDGFTFTGGDATGSPYGYQYGGGAVLHLTSPEIRNCVFSANYGIFGGGIANVGQNTARIEACRFVANSAEVGGGYYGGGSIPRSVISECEFIANHAVITGGGAVIDTQAVDIRDCLFLTNSSDDKAGAIAFYRNHQTNMSGCTVVGNYARTTAGVRVTNAANVTLENCIIADNLGGTPLYRAPDSDLLVGCTNVFGNSLTNALPTGTVDLGGNFSLDPLFVGGEGPAAYRLQVDSPCRADNHPAGAGCGRIGAFE